MPFDNHSTWHMPTKADRPTANRPQAGIRPRMTVRHAQWGDGLTLRRDGEFWLVKFSENERLIKPQFLKKTEPKPRSKNRLATGMTVTHTQWGRGILRGRSTDTLWKVQFGEVERLIGQKYLTEAKP